MVIIGKWPDSIQNDDIARSFFSQSSSNSDGVSTALSVALVVVRRPKKGCSHSSNDETVCHLEDAKFQ